MANERRLQDYSNGAIVSILTAMEMPDDDVTERTQRTRTVGAYTMMSHLIEGEYDPLSRKEMEEFLGRVVANAERQGVVLSPPTSEL